MNADKLKELQQLAKEVRKDIITEIYHAKSGHPGGSLSVTDMITYLYKEALNVKPNAPLWEDRDRFVLSKGHTCPALYGILAELGFFPKEELVTLRKIGSKLQGHPDMKKVPGIDYSTGSLGQGISGACGIALAGKLGQKDYKVYTILGDGEIEEGEVWEAAMFASHKQLNNLCVIIDNNNLQIDGAISDVCSPYPIKEKFDAFGFNTVEINGHDFNEIESAVTFFKTNTNNKPTAIIAKTIKGKGVSFMENQVGWHGKAPNEEEYNVAMKELGE